MKHQSHLFLLSATLLLGACSLQNPPDPQTSSGSMTETDEMVFADTDLLSGADQLSVPLVASSGTGGLQTLYMLTKDGLKKITEYNENLPDGSLALTHILNPDRSLYIAGVGDGFSVFDREGNDQTAQYGFLKNKFFGIDSFYRLDSDRYVYGLHDADTQGGSAVAGIHVATMSEGSEKVFPLSRVGLGTLQGLQPLCLSGDAQSLYVRYQGWEGFEYGSVWKLDLSTLESMEAITKTDEIYSYHCSDRNDMILGIRTGFQEGYGMGGVPWPPSSLVLYNGINGKSETLVSYEDKLIESAYITPDGDKIFYIVITPAAVSTNGDSPFYDDTAVRELFMMDIHGNNQKSLGAYYSIAGMSKDGQIVVAGQLSKTGPYADSQQYTVIRTSDGTSKPLSEDGSVTMIRCSYGHGFDCNY